MTSAQEWISHLQLIPHPEGGHYRETYRSQEQLQAPGFSGLRNISTAIYFLLEGDERSHFHRIASDELWFFHEGETLEIVMMHEDRLETVVLGKNIGKGECLQAIVPAGVWFAARLKKREGFALVSCTVAPGFDFSDFELGKKSDLLEKYPQHAVIVEELGME